MFISPLKVLEFPSDEDYSHVTFLDEFRIVVSRCDRPTGTSDLTVFDTQIPQNRSEGLSRFELPSRYRCNWVQVSVDCDRPLGTVNRAEPFAVDPTQALFVVELFLLDGPRTHVLLAVRMNALIEHTGSYIPWEEWGGGSVVTEIPWGRIKCSTFVHGVHVVVVALHVRGNYRLHTFDFSKRGCHALPVWSGGSGVSERRFTLEGGREVPLEGFQRVSADPVVMGLVGDGIVVCSDPVSHLPRFRRNDVVD